MRIYVAGGIVDMRCDCSLQVSYQCVCVGVHVRHDIKNHIDTKYTNLTTTLNGINTSLSNQISDVMSDVNTHTDTLIGNLQTAITSHVNNTASNIDSHVTSEKSDINQ
jgi:gas vesicle protein